MSELLPNTEFYATYSGKCEANIGSLRGPATSGEYRVITEVEHKWGPNGEVITEVGFAKAGFGNQMFANHVLPEAVLNNNGS